MDDILLSMRVLIFQSFMKEIRNEMDPNIISFQLFDQKCSRINLMDEMKLKIYYQERL